MRDQQELLKFIKEQYPPGTRVRLAEMQDPYAPVPSGTEGTINFQSLLCRSKCFPGRSSAGASVPIR
jgi:hypothetical protein